MSVCRERGAGACGSPGWAGPGARRGGVGCAGGRGASGSHRAASATPCGAGGSVRHHNPAPGLRRRTRRRSPHRATPAPRIPHRAASATPCGAGGSVRHHNPAPSLRRRTRRRSPYRATPARQHDKFARCEPSASAPRGPRGRGRRDGLRGDDVDEPDLDRAAAGRDRHGVGRPGDQVTEGVLRAVPVVRPDHQAVPDRGVVQHPERTGPGDRRLFVRMHRPRVRAA